MVKLVPVEQEKKRLRLTPVATLGHKVGAVVDSLGQSLTGNFSDEIEAGLSTGFGFLGDYDQKVSEVRQRMQENQEAAPGYYLGGTVAGSVGAGVGLVKAGLSTLPRLAGAGLKKRAAGAAAEGAVLGSIYGAGGAEGGITDRLKGSLDGGVTGGAIGGAIPVVGAGVRTIGGAAYNAVAPKVGAALNPVGEANRRVGEAFRRDAQMQQFPLTKADEATAQLNNQQLMNFDRGGETVRALSRSVANQSPESRGVMERVISDRFEGQAGRAKDVLSRVAGGQVDDLAYQDALKSAATKANRPAYARAYNSPAAQSMWHEGFEQLMQAPAIQRAARQAAGKGANRAAVEGFTPVRNPFNFDEAGRYTLKTNPDGSVAKPTLQFWDQVKRNLDDQIGVAQRSGQRSTVSDLMAIKSRLVDTLDSTVPEYRAARQGAAAFFGAEDALDAGRKFVSQNKDLRGALRSIGKMAPAERDAFKTGFAAELSEKLGQVNDRRNVINQIFNSQNARRKVEAVFGREGAKELEQFVKLESAMDMMRGAMGNSTTARQLVEMGLGAGGGFYMTGDINGALVGAALTKGSRFAAQKVDERVLREVAKILISDDRSALAGAAKRLAKSREMAKALDQLMDRIEGGSMVPAIEMGATPQRASQ